jgi:hypothetical protein
MTETSSCRRIHVNPPRRDSRRRFVVLGALVGLVAGLMAAPASADKIKQPIAVFSGLDKITGRIITFEVATNETVQFGSLQITERVCYSRPPTEAPQTDSFIEVDNVDADKQSKRIFTGWMFAGSPSLHPLEHPVYDIWLLRCKGPGQLISTPPETAAAPAPAAPPLRQSDAPKPQTQQGQKPKPAGATTAQPSSAPPPIDGGPIEVGPPPGFSAPPDGQQGQPPAFAPAQPAPNSDDDN